MHRKDEEENVKVILAYSRNQSCFQSDTELLNVREGAAG